MAKSKELQVMEVWQGQPKRLGQSAQKYICSFSFSVLPLVMCFVLRNALKLKVSRLYYSFKAHASRGPGAL